jgi:hypothetical protein
MIVKQNAKCKDILVISNEETPALYSSEIKSIHHDIEKKANLAMNIMMKLLKESSMLSTNIKFFEL